ncbi:MAG TPA: hypothetical protein VGG62_07475 [Terracidiphilus sp.]|jgi:hypothetical protein
MKKLVFASVVALASVGFFASPSLRAQDQGQISIADPAEYNAFQMFQTQTDPKAKAAAGESFLEKYPQSKAKAIVLDSLLDAYQATGDAAKVVDTAGKLQQIDPNNLKAILYSVLIKKQQCGKTSDAATCDDAAAMAKKGLQVPKPAATADDEWKKLTGAAYPIFHSAIALDDALAKKDFKGAQEEYTEELKMYTDDQSKSQGLVDTLQLAQALSQPGSTQDLPKAVWEYARVWAYAPPAYKAQIEPKLEYYYKKYHGSLDGLDALKQQAQASTFPPGTYHIDPAKSPAEQIHDLIAATPDLNTLALADKETVLAVGSKDDADKLWALLKDKETQVPGIVISADANTIKVAVTQDAKDSKVADFIVNLKKPLTDAELKTIIPGFEFKTQPDNELVGTYDSYRQVPATDTTAQSAEIVLREGEFIAAKKKTAPVHHAPVHRPAAH